MVGEEHDVLPRRRPAGAPAERVAPSDDKDNDNQSQETTTAIAEEEEESCFAGVGRDHDACPPSSRVSSAPGVLGPGGDGNVVTSSDSHMIVETDFDYDFNGCSIVAKESS